MAYIATARPAVPRRTMTRFVRQSCRGIAGLALLVPAPLVGQAVTRPNVLGTWRYTRVLDFRWDSANGVAARPYEILLTLGSDSTLTTRTRYPAETGDSVVKIEGSELQPDAGKWWLAGDTLVNVDVQTLPAQNMRPAQLLTRTARYQLSRVGDTMTLALVETVIKQQDSIWPWHPANKEYQFARVDTTKPLPVPALPPPTLTRADLVGTWATTLDTVVLRADGTWTADTLVVQLKDATQPKGAAPLKGPPSVISGCGIAPVSPKTKTLASGSGKWYLGPANTVVLVDMLGRTLCDGIANHWRGGQVKLRGRQLVPVTNYDSFVIYERTK